MSDMGRNGEVWTGIEAGRLSRRGILAVGAAMAAFGATVPAFAQKAAGGKAAASAPNAALIAAAKKCGKVGEVCLKHCIKLTKAGDTSLADCMRNVRAMLVVCSAVGRLAEQDAKRLKDLTKVCLDVCTDCEAECRKHESHHVECKNCANSCAAMIAEAKKLLAA